MEICSWLRTIPSLLFIVLRGKGHWIQMCGVSASSITKWTKLNIHLYLWFDFEIQTLNRWCVSIKPVADLTIILVWLLSLKHSTSDKRNIIIYDESGMCWFWGQHESVGLKVGCESFLLCSGSEGIVGIVPRVNWVYYGHRTTATVYIRCSLYNRVADPSIRKVECTGKSVLTTCSTIQVFVHCSVV